MKLFIALLILYQFDYSVGWYAFAVALAGAGEWLKLEARK